MQYMAAQNNKSGFTIIEVLIVLAIASFILTMVFLAVPALQASQRDARRKRELTIFYNAVKEYQRNNRIPGKNPFDAANTGDEAKFEGFINDYLGPEFDQYDIVLKSQHDDHKLMYADDTIVFYPRHFCPTNPTEAPDGSFDLPGHAVTGWGTHPQHAWAVLVSLERPKSYLCLDQGNIDLP